MFLKLSSGEPGLPAVNQKKWRFNNRISAIADKARVVRFLQYNMHGQLWKSMFIWMGGHSCCWLSDATLTNRLWSLQFTDWTYTVVFTVWLDVLPPLLLLLRSALGRRWAVVGCQWSRQTIMLLRCSGGSRWSDVTLPESSLNSLSLFPLRCP